MVSGAAGAGGQGGGEAAGSAGSDGAVRQDPAVVGQYPVRGAGEGFQSDGFRYLYPAKRGVRVDTRSLNLPAIIARAAPNG